MWDKLLARYWLEQSYQCQFPVATLQSIMDEAFDTMDSVIQQVENSLPDNFPKHISDAVFFGMHRVKNQKGYTFV